MIRFPIFAVFVIISLCLISSTIITHAQSIPHDSIQEISSINQPKDLDTPHSNDDFSTTTSNFDLQQACATMTTCSDCYKIMGCHFCEFDQQCHVYGSIFGCVVGSSCPRKQCIRKEPQYIGYQRPDSIFVLGVIGLFLLIFALLGLCLNIACFGCRYICACCYRDDNNSSEQYQRQNDQVVILHATTDLATAANNVDEDRFNMNHNGYQNNSYIPPTPNMKNSNNKNNNQLNQGSNHTKVSNNATSVPKNGSFEIDDSINDDQSARWINRNGKQRR